jgi:hypothetical protein
MKVVGFNLISFSASRQSIPLPALTLKSDIKVTDIKLDNLPFIKEGEALQFHFEISFNYMDNENINDNKSPKKNKTSPYGQINIKGIIIATTPKEESQKILQSWKKKEIPKEVRYPLYNLIFSKCSVKAMQWEEELGLPYHIPMPKINEQNKQDNPKYTN